MSQEQLASILYVTRQTISNWENAKSYPDIAMLLVLSDLYNVSIDELIKGDEKMKQNLKDDSVNQKERDGFVITNSIGLMLVTLPRFILENNSFSEFIAGIGASIIIINTLKVFLTKKYPNFQRVKQSTIKN